MESFQMKRMKKIKERIKRWNKKKRRQIGKKQNEKDEVLKMKEKKGIAMKIKISIGEEHNKTKEIENEGRSQEN